jgi:hypothetical protein
MSAGACLCVGVGVWYTFAERMLTTVVHAVVVLMRRFVQGNVRATTVA